jgi:hypothetical protein
MPVAGVGTCIGCARDKGERAFGDYGMDGYEHTRDLRARIKELEKKVEELELEKYGESHEKQ